MFSTMKSKSFRKLTPDDVKILMTNAVTMSVHEVIELYSLRWQIRVVLQGTENRRWDSPSTVSKASNPCGRGSEIAITTVLFLEFTAKPTECADRSQSKKERQWWETAASPHRPIARPTAGNVPEARSLHYLADRLVKPVAASPSSSGLPRTSHAPGIPRRPMKKPENSATSKSACEGRFFRSLALQARIGRAKKSCRTSTIWPGKRRKLARSRTPSV